MDANFTAVLHALEVHPLAQERTRLWLIDSLESHRKNRYHASTASVKPIAARAVEDSISADGFAVGFGVGADVVDVGAGVAGVVGFGVGAGVGMPKYASIPSMS